MRKEADVLRSVRELLTRLGIFWIRNNSGAFTFEHKGKKRFFRAGCPGMADLLAFTHMVLVGERPKAKLVSFPTWIECKSTCGKQTAEQELFQRLVESEGHSYLLVRSAQEVYEWLKEHAGK